MAILPDERYIPQGRTISLDHRGFTECFGSHNIMHPHSEDAVRVDRALTALGHRSPLLIHSHLETLCVQLKQPKGD